MDQTIASSAGKPVSEVKGIKGWLILPLLGLIFTPIVIAVQFVRDLMPVLEPKVWEAVTTPGAKAYHPLWGPLITFEVVTSLFIFGFTLWLMFLFFTKSRHVPALYIVWMLLIVAVHLFDYLLAGRIPAVANLDESGPGDLVRNFIHAAIWTPYFLVSKRVKNTFVEDRTAPRLTMTKHLTFLVVLSFLIALFSMVALGEPILGPEGVGYLIGRSLMIVLLTVLLSLLPAGLYWLFKRKKMPGFVSTLWWAWSAISVFSLIGGMISR